jgi:3-hydroxybutyryl-CoA dehydrogenase
MRTSTFDSIALIGCGTIGSGVACFLSLNGIRVTVYSRSPSSSRKARDIVHQRLHSLQSSGGITSLQVERALQNLRFVDKIDGMLDQESLVLESIVENLREKQELFAKLDKLVERDAVLTSNTSSLRLAEVFEPVSYKDRVVGLHWFAPADLLPLVEIGNAGQTSPEVLNALRDWLLQLGKNPIVLTNTPVGYIVNRMQAAILREACFLTEVYRVKPEDIDKAIMDSIGLRYGIIGCFRTADLGGLDVFTELLSNLLPELTSSVDVPETIQRLIRKGYLGAKAGAGFFTHTDKEIAEILLERDEWIAQALRTRTNIQGKASSIEKADKDSDL